MTLPKINMTDILKLESASMVLAIPDWHTKGNYARDSEENKLQPSRPTACKFCLVGALDAVDVSPVKISRLLYDTINDLFGKRYSSLVAFNDAPETTNLEVSELLWVTAQTLRQAV